MPMKIVSECELPDELFGALELMSNVLHRFKSRLPLPEDPLPDMLERALRDTADDLITLLTHQSEPSTYECVDGFEETLQSVLIDLLRWFYEREIIFADLLEKTKPDADEVPAQQSIARKRSKQAGSRKTGKRVAGPRKRS